MTSDSLPSRFRGRFSTDPDRLRPHASAAGPFYGTPRAVAVPADAEDVRILVRWAADTGRSLVPRGAGTAMPGGNVGGDVSVDLATPFRTLGSLDRDRRLLHVGAGAVAAEVDAAARSAGLFIPALPSSADRCTIGGMVSTNAAGARSFKYGSIRAWVRGLDVVLADGRSLELSAGARLPPPFSDLLDRLRPRWPSLVESWPRVSKNSSGYALDRFLPSGDPVQLVVGSEGTLGLVTGVTLELAPEPEARALVLLAVRDADELARIAKTAGDLNASACEFFGRRFIEIAELHRNPRFRDVAGSAFALVMLELDGPERDVAASLERLGGIADGAGMPSLQARTPDERARLWSVRHAASPRIARAADRGLVSMQFIEDSVVPPGRLPTYLHGLDRILEEVDTDAVVFGHAGDGNVHVNPLIDVRRADWRDRVRAVLDRTADLVARLGGTLSGEHGDGRVRAPYLSRIWSEPTLHAFREVKDRLDPSGRLNPGVVLPLADQDPMEGLGEGLGIA